MPDFKTNLMDHDALQRTVRRLSHEIVEKNHGCKNVCIVGIIRRGVPLAKMIAENIKKIEGYELPVGEVDVSGHRDDIIISEFENKSDIPFDINNKHIIMVDDVLYTGRTARAAMDALISIGRPASIQFAVLVDRGHRELPIYATFVGKNFPTSRSEMIKVIAGTDNDRVDLYSI